MRIETERLVLTASAPEDLNDYLAFRARNATHLARREPFRPPDWNTADAAWDRLEGERREKVGGATTS